MKQKKKKRKYKIDHTNPSENKLKKKDFFIRTLTNSYVRRFQKFYKKIQKNPKIRNINIKMEA